MFFFEIDFDIVRCPASVYLGALPIADTTSRFWMRRSLDRTTNVESRGAENCTRAKPPDGHPTQKSSAIHSSYSARPPGETKFTALVSKKRPLHSLT